MKQSGLAALLSSLPGIVWVGVSAGSMVMTPRIGEQFANCRLAAMTVAWARSTSASFRTWKTNACPRTPSSMLRAGRPPLADRHTPSTIRPRLASPTAR
ncbi:hypothetical protein [Frateuria terrea]